MIVSKFNCTISTSSRLSQSAWMFATVRRVAASMGGGSSSFLPMAVIAPRGAGPGTPVVQRAAGACAATAELGATTARCVNGCERSLHAAARAFKRRDDARRERPSPGVC